MRMKHKSYALIRIALCILLACFADIALAQNRPTLTITTTPTTVVAVAGSEVSFILTGDIAFPRAPFIVVTQLSGSVGYLKNRSIPRFLFPPGVKEAIITREIEPPSDSNRCSAELVITLPPRNDYFIAGLNTAKVRIVPQNPAVCIRSKVFLEGPLQ